MVIEMQFAVPRLVALAGVIVEPFEQRGELIEVLQSCDVLFLDFFRL